MKHKNRLSRLKFHLGSISTTYDGSGLSFYWTNIPIGILASSVLVLWSVPFWGCAIDIEWPVNEGPLFGNGRAPICLALYGQL